MGGTGGWTVVCFFFSSRRRHTVFDCDWSSDVCSSDLYHRLRGARVLMISGTDEHGTPITYGAVQLGISPREFADRNNEIIVEDLRRLGQIGRASCRERV